MKRNVTCFSCIDVLIALLQVLSVYNISLKFSGKFVGIVCYCYRVDKRCNKDAHCIDYSYRLCLKSMNANNFYPLHSTS